MIESSLCVPSPCTIGCDVPTLVTVNPTLFETSDLLGPRSCLGSTLYFSLTPVVQI